MTMMSNDDFASVVTKAVQSTPFEPMATYDADGDCIEFIASPDSFYAERIDGLVTVYYSQETKEIVGSLIKGVSKFCSRIQETMPGFKIEIHDGRVQLHHIFRAHLWSSCKDDDSLPTVTYKKLIAMAEEAQIEAEICHT